MQSKGAIKLFAIVLALVCLYQLSFTFVTGRVEKKADQYAGNDTTKLRTYLDSMSSVKVFPLFGFTYKECQDKEINLGLDLKGGMNVTLEVSMVDLIRALSNYSTDPTFNKAIADAQTQSVNSQKDFVDLFYESFTKLDPHARLSAIFATRDLQGKVDINSTNEQVLTVIKTEAADAFDRTYNIIKKRIDKFGVAQPNVQKLQNNRILVELPGVKDPERVRKILQGTAKLEFWTTFDNADIYPKLKDINDYLKRIQGGDTTVKDTTNKSALAMADTSKGAAKSDSARKAEELFKKLSGAGDTGKNALAGDTAAEKLNKLRKDNPLFSLMNPQLMQDEKQNVSPAKGPMIGIAAVKDTGKINRIFAMDAVKARLPSNFKALWGSKPLPGYSIPVLELVAVRVPRDGRAPLEGDVITDARKQKSQFTDNWEVSMSMNEQGATVWRRLTKDNVGHSIAVVLDDYVYSFPTVQGEIAGGNSQITGRFSLEESEDLATVLSVGKLPAPARIVEDTVVGPTLGQEAITKGLRSFIIALIVVLIFMVAYYNNAGLIADVALFCNVFFVLGVLASLGAVLTLPGIAGIVLTIGLSVDANILIFERVREELALGKGIRLAVSDGFKHAYSSIIDSNVTTLILGIILYIFGTGPIQGFATTLIIGILSSLFCAIFITRLIFDWRLGNNKEIKFWNNTTKGAFKNIHINFVGRRKIYYIFSSAIIIAGIFAFVTKGLNFGVDFQGGRTFVVRFDKPVQTDAVIDALKGPLGKAPEVKTYGAGGNQVRITSNYLINETGATVEDQVDKKISDGLGTLNNKFQIMSSQQVGPTIANDIKAGALGAVLFGCLLMFLFIFVRFKKWTYGLGAVVALFHDVLVVLSVYTIFNGILPFSLEIDQAFVAAILTVMGYSMTDTVVVFDRIREFVGVHHHSQDQEKVINDALNATLSRTINTSLTIFFVLLSIFIFGSEVIRGFTFALLIGIVIGTYSSICIATPIVVDLAKKNIKQLQ